MFAVVNDSAICNISFNWGIVWFDWLVLEIYSISQNIYNVDDEAESLQ